MSTEYDKEQDERIAANTEAISSLVRYLRELRDHFEPFIGYAESAPEKWRKAVQVAGLVAKLGIVFVLLAKGGEWYLNKWLLHNMADKYAEAARALYETENNPDVALPFLDKALEIEEDCLEYLFRRAYMQGMAATRTLLNLGRPLGR